jgi:hypothetical protein
MSGRKQAAKVSKAREEIHMAETVHEEIAEGFDVEEGMDIVHELEPQEEMVGDEGHVEEDVEGDVSDSKKKSKKRKRSAYAFFVAVCA